MTDNNDDLISSLYPPPPPYVRFFTAENVQKLEEWNGDKGKMDVDGAEPPGELKLLVPPKVPEGDHYRGYGNIWSFEDKIPSLSESGWKQLYNDDEETSQKKIEVLHKLKEALLLNFLELIGIVSIEPEQFNSKIEDLKILLINISHIINTYRPHQSRESLITMLRRQIDLKKSEISTIDRVMSDIKREVLTSVNKSTSQLTDPEPIDEITVESPRTEILNKVLSSID